MKKRQMTDRLQGMAEDDSVAHVYRIEPNGRPCVAWDDASEIKVGAKLYAAPCEWVGLTEQDVHDSFQFTELVKQLDFDRDRQEWCENFAAHLEAKLKEKNT
jgi:hypothetical protein